MRFVIGAPMLLALACATAAPAPAPPSSPPTRRARPEAPARRPPPPAPVAPAVDEPAPAVDDAPAVDAPTPAVDEVVEQGIASYYADSLAGRRTASGERYRPERATCAHRTLPFGTHLRVTAVSSGRTSECRVNDRGPWVKGRVLDVSRSVAKELGMLGPGVLEVTVVVVPPAAD